MVLKSVIKVQEVFNKITNFISGPPVDIDMGIEIEGIDKVSEVDMV